jgi:hypothetical protein
VPGVEPKRAPGCPSLEFRSARFARPRAPGASEGGGLPRVPPPHDDHSPTDCRAGRINDSRGIPEGSARPGRPDGSATCVTLRVDGWYNSTDRFAAGAHDKRRQGHGFTVVELVTGEPHAGIGGF